MLDGVIFDCETKNPVRNDYQVSRNPKILKWADNWQDFEAMGISVIGCYDWNSKAYVLFDSEENPGALPLEAFPDFIRGRNHYSFNGTAFDLPLIAASLGVNLPEGYDLMKEFRLAAGLPPTWQPEEKSMGWSFKLGYISQTNLGYGKSSSGRDAPFDWQYGKKTDVRSHCFTDVKMLKELLTMVEAGLPLINPNNWRQVVLRRPAEVFTAATQVA